MFDGCQVGDTRQVNIHAALYTQWSGGSMADLGDPSIHGVEECSESDHGRMVVNPREFLCEKTISEIHLHPIEDNMAVSPNNCAFLLNLTLPIINFYVVMGHNTEQGLFKLTILNVTFLNEDALANCSILSALNSEMLLQSIVADDDKQVDLELVYLRRLKNAIEDGVMS